MPFVEITPEKSVAEWQVRNVFNRTQTIVAEGMNYFLTLLFSFAQYLVRGKDVL